MNTLMAQPMPVRAKDTEAIKPILNKKTRIENQGARMWLDRDLCRANQFHSLISIMLLYDNRSKNYLNATYVNMLIHPQRVNGLMLI